MKEAGSLKAKCNLAHASTQGFARYGFSPLIINKIMESVKFANGLHPAKHYDVIGLRPDKNVSTRHIYAVAVDYKWIPIVWCKSTNTVVTVLPEDCLGEYSSTLPTLISKKVDNTPLPTTHEEIDAELEEIAMELVRLNTARKVEGIDKADKRSLSLLIDEIGAKRKKLNAIKTTLPMAEPPQSYQGVPELEHFRIISRLLSMVRLSTTLLDVSDDSSLVDIVSDAKSYLKRNGIDV